jgi:hypothetical protein
MPETLISVVSSSSVPTCAAPEPPRLSAGASTRAAGCHARVPSSCVALRLFAPAREGGAKAAPGHLHGARGRGVTHLHGGDSAREQRGDGGVRRVHRDGPAAVRKRRHRHRAQHAGGRHGVLLDGFQLRG